MFLYFAETSEPLQAIREARFWDVSPESLPDVRADKGPGGKPGVMLISPGEHRHYGYHAGDQEWVNCGDWWIGWDKTAKPKPEHLQRSTLVEGMETKLNDGNVWQCPIIRRWEGLAFTPAVPQVVGRINGEFVAEVMPRYREVWELSATVWDKFAAKSNITVGELFSACVAFLAVNYRVGDEECTVLQLLTSTTMQEIVTAGLDLATITAVIDEEKKSLSSAAGA